MNAAQSIYAPGIEITAPVSPAFAEIVTPEALLFIATLQRGFGVRRAELLTARATRQQDWDAGKLPDFLPETAHIRADDSWRVNACPADLQDRRVEITGPVDRKMVINALNCGANTFMADFEDSNTPTWTNQIEGQINLRDAIRRSISFTNEAGKSYSLNEKTAVLIVRPRGWHLNEKHMLVDGAPVSGGIFDFGLYFFHNAKELIKRHSGPYFYIPKMESHLEARLWNDIFCMAQDDLGILRDDEIAQQAAEALHADVLVGRKHLARHFDALGKGEERTLAAAVGHAHDDALEQLSRAAHEILMPACHRVEGARIDGSDLDHSRSSR